MQKATLNFKFEFYMMHIAKVSDYSYTIVNRNAVRSVPELRATKSRIVAQYGL